MQSLKILLTTVVLLGSVSAHAVLVSTGVACDGNGTAMTALGRYVDCAGSFAGSNRDQAADVTAVIQQEFGLSVVKSNETILFGTSFPHSDLFFLSGNIRGLLVVAMRSGDAFSLYGFDGGPVGISGFTYDTFGIGFRNASGQLISGQALTSADLYVPALPPVPEPEAYALMLAGLGFMRFVARRRNV
jgi:hypothetical protein